MMKKNLLLTLLLGFVSWQISFAALPNGSVAEDFTLTDLNGNSHHLYSYLNADKPVVIDFSATWCGPCWNYHTSGVLEDLWDQYGPNGGTDEIMVLFIEPDASTNTDCLYGLPSCVGGTYGDWTNGTGYPIIDLVGADLTVGSDYNVTFYPTLYGISPDKRTWLVGQASETIWERWLFESFSLETSETVTDAFCNDNGEITVNATGGFGNLSYNWSNGATGSTITNLSPGTYDLQITDGNGYFVERSYVINGPASGLPLDYSLINSQDVDCNGNSNGMLEVQGVNGNYGYSYVWSNGQTGPVATNLTAGSYDVEITDAQNCTETFTLNVNEPDVLTSVAIETDAACGDDTGEVLFVPIGGVAPHMFDIGNGFEPYPNFTDLAPGIYPYNHIDDNGCLYSDQFEIETVGIPTAMATATNDIDCIMTEVAVSGSGSSTGNEYSYQWTTTNGNIVSDPTLIDITVDQEGDYELEITNNTYGCVEYATASVDATVSTPTADAGMPSTVSCNIPEITLDGSGSSSGDFSYLWTTNDGNIVSGDDTVNPIVNAAGTYTIEVTNNVDGCSSTAEVVIPGDFTQPDVSAAGGELTCSSTSIEICATVEAGVTVVWDTPNGPVEGTCVTVSAAGDYTATATGSNGCSNEAVATVTQSADIPQTAIEEPSTITCDITEITLEGSLTGDINDHTITWTTADGNIVSGETTLTPVVNSAGTYVMEAVNNINGCSSQIAVTVESDAALPVAGFSFNSSVGVLELINGSSNFEGEVIWDLGNGETAEGNEVTAMYDETGIYTVCVTVSNECGDHTYCEDIQFITIMGYAEETSHVVCNGDNNGSITVTPSGGLPAYDIVWEGPNGFTSNDLSISDLAPGTYTMNLTDQAGNSATEQFEINEPEALVSDIMTTDVSCNGLTDGSAVISVTGGTAPYEFDWEGGLDPNELPAGSYNVNVVDANGCILAATAEILEPDALMISSTDVVNADNGQTNGSITITPEGGTGEITVTWDNGMSGATITDLAPGFYTPTLEDENGCMVTLDPIEVSSSTGINELDFVNSFVLNPNPATTNVNMHLNLNASLDANIVIRNVVGQVVYTKNYNSINSIHTTIDVSMFESGLYTLTLTSGNKRASHKFIVLK